MKPVQSSNSDKLMDFTIYGFEKSYERVNRFFAITVFITAIIGAGSDTIIYFKYKLTLLYIINLILIVLLLTDLFLLLTKKLNLKTAFTILLYITLLNITITHIQEFNYENFLAKAILIGFWGILFVVLSGMVLGRRHPYLVMIWAISLLIFDIFRSNSDFLIETIPIIIITLAGLSYGVLMYMKLLGVAFQKNQKTIVEISRQKSFIEKQTDELEFINSNLSELQTRQKDLIEMIVHDMKNPLNSILNNSIQSRANSAQKDIHEAGRHMLMLVEDLLDVHSMEKTNPKLALETINIYETILEAHNQIEFLLFQRTITLEINVKNDTYVQADREVLIRVFINLFTNAIKHSPANSKIEVSISIKDNKDTTIYIKDQGEGIPENYRESVFNKFVQVISRKSGSTRSSGLGLAFCKMSIEYMHGSIWVENSTPKGTTIAFSLSIGKSAEEFTLRKARTIQRMVLSAEDRSLISPIAANLHKLQLYESGLILQELDKLTLQNNRIENWAEDIKNAMYAVNYKKFKELLGKVNTN